MCVCVCVVAGGGGGVGCCSLLFPDFCLLPPHRLAVLRALHMERHVVAVIGVGPGLGFSIAHRFAHEGYTVAILARSYERLERFAEQIIAMVDGRAHISAIEIDCSDANSIKQAFEAVNSLGFVEVLVYNAGSDFPFPPPKFMDITNESFEKSLKVSCIGAFQCVQQVLPAMIERRKGTILFTGATASVRGSAGFAELACGKFSLRALSQCLAREFQPQGIHVANIIIDGFIGSQRMDSNARQHLINPDAIAQAYWQLHTQHQSAWTQELDLRSFLHYLGE